MEPLPRAVLSAAMLQNQRNQQTGNGSEVEEAVEDALTELRGHIPDNGDYVSKISCTIIF